MEEENWTLANTFPSLFSKIPDTLEYSDIGTNDFCENENEITEKLYKIETESNEKMKKSGKSKPKSSRSHKSSARSFTSNISLSNTQNLGFNNSPNPIQKIPQKISHVVKKVKKKSKLKLVHNHYERQKMQPKANLKNSVAPKLPKHMANNVPEPMTVLYPHYKIQFNYRPRDVVRREGKEACPMTIHYMNGDTETKFVNGTRVVIHGKLEYTFFINGDIQQKFPDGATAYYYKSNNAIEFIHPNKTHIIQYIDGRRETILPNGENKVTFHEPSYALLPKADKSYI